MLTVGLTGSIGMGKSTVAKMFAEEGVPLFDADAAVHALYAKGGAAVEPVRAAFPEAVVDGAVDRAVLSRLVLGKPEEIKTLERIVHPLVGQARQRFLEAAKASGALLAILEIQMLLEGSGWKDVDVVVVVSAPADMQRQRVLSRPGMTEEKFAAILSNQMPDSEKRKRADYIIDTGVSLQQTRAQVRDLLAILRERAKAKGAD